MNLYIVKTMSKNVFRTGSALLLWSGGVHLAHDHRALLAQQELYQDGAQRIPEPPSARYTHNSQHPTANP